MPRPRLLTFTAATATVATAAVVAIAWTDEQPAPLPLDERSAPYDPAGRYVGPARAVSNIRPPDIVLGPGGLPLVYYRDVGYRANPVTASQYGLWAYGAYLHSRDTEHRRIVLRVADWLVAKQTRGRWLYDFDFGFNGVSLEQPWSSAMAQGQAMSLLQRAYRLTRDDRYRQAALRALAPLLDPVDRGGLSRCFLGDCLLQFFEEYPTTPPSYVLNGFMFTLIGLYDLASIAPGSDALEFYAAGRRTLKAAISSYDADGLSTYDLTHLTVRGREAEIVNKSYQAWHVYLLRALDSLEPDRQLRFYAERWAASVSRAPG